jgi:hypothetical protein
MPTDNFPSPSSAGIAGWFIAIWVIFAVLIVGGAIVSFIVRASVLRKGRLNPFLAKEQLESRLAQSQLLQPPEPAKPIEERLAELDDLQQRGVITAEEKAAARAKIIAGG